MSSITDHHQRGGEADEPRARFAGMTGSRYWRSLDEYSHTPEFQQMLEREFPSQLAVWEDSAGRRDFLKLMAASLALAGVTGCSREPAEAIVPYVRAPEEFVPGEASVFATTVCRRGYGLGVLAKSHMGRPTKIEGNPDHPSSLGATDAQTQASVLDLYDPDRSQTIRRRDVIQTWERFTAELLQASEKAKADRGAAVRIVTGTVTSPTTARQLQSILETLPEARWHQFEPAANDNLRLGARDAFGRFVDVHYRFDQADVVLSLDADFLSSMPGSVSYSRDFIERRRAREQDSATMSRLYVVESTPTITGAMADHRLAVKARDMEGLVRMMARELRVANVEDVSETSGDFGISPGWFTSVVNDLRAAGPRSVIVAGAGQPPAVHTLVHAINEALRNVGTTVLYMEPVEARPEIIADSMADLVHAMAADKVKLLVILGCNPVYSAPAKMKFADALARVPLRVHLSNYFDETSFLCDWHIPQAHYLESWSDLRAFDGTASIVQPLIAPLYGGKTIHEVLAILQGTAGRTSYEIVRETWRARLGEDDFESRWRQMLHDGIVPETATAGVEITVVESSFGATVRQPSADLKKFFEITFRTDPCLETGEQANNGWLQELPKPLSKLTWDNVAAVSPAMAQELSLANEDVIEISIGDDKLQAPVWITPGQPEGSISLTFGYGRTRVGSVGKGVGYNAFLVKPLVGAWHTQGLVRKREEKHPLSTTQSHHSMEGRDIVRTLTVADLATGGLPQDAKHHGDSFPSLYPEYEYSGNSWGMVIDQTACIGCNACVVACQAENNIPVVGKEQVRVGREMHWLRIDRYFAGSLKNPTTLFQPMMCVHCELAPCEMVCPVAATVHDAEGTNNMVYNRCVGTRYCSNNCPYKVRRFNYLQYADETTPSLKLLRNPDVTVRSRGVMEKCTYCIQRISHARIDAKKENRAIRDGEVVTACQQACPTQAIVFGNLNDPAAQVTALKHSPLNYGVLAELNTQPRTTYLARVFNPNESIQPPELKQVTDKDKPHS